MPNLSQASHVSQEQARRAVWPVREVPQCGPARGKFQFWGKVVEMTWFDYRSMQNFILGAMKHMLDHFIRSRTSISAGLIKSIQICWIFVFFKDFFEKSIFQKTATSAAMTSNDKLARANSAGRPVQKAPAGMTSNTFLEHVQDTATHVWIVCNMCVECIINVHRMCMKFKWSVHKMHTKCI